MPENERTALLRKRLSSVGEAMTKQLPIADVVKALANVLGSRVVAVIAGVKKTSEVRSWINGEAEPACEQRLRYALEATIVLLEEGPEIAYAWFTGTNRYFDQKPPALILREGPDEVGVEVVRAARAFIWM